MFVGHARFACANICRLASYDADPIQARASQDPTTLQVDMYSNARNLHTKIEIGVQRLSASVWYPPTQMHRQLG